MGFLQSKPGGLCIDSGGRCFAVVGVAAAAAVVVDAVVDQCMVVRAATGGYYSQYIVRRSGTEAVSLFMLMVPAMIVDSKMLVRSVAVVLFVRVVFNKAPLLHNLLMFAFWISCMSGVFLLLRWS